MRIGIIGAMEVEVELLKGVLENGVLACHAGMDFFSGTLSGTPCVVVRSGVGKVNAALCVQALCDLFHVTHVVNTGVAGSLDEALHVGDLVVSTDAVCHDVDATVFGYAPGQVPGMQVAFPADEVLREAALAAAAETAPDRTAVAGRVATGDAFVADAATKRRIREQFGASCCEMEGAAIAQACTANSVPFAIVRAISDNADGSEGPAYDVFEQKAALACAAIVENMVTRLEQSCAGQTRRR